MQRFAHWENAAAETATELRGKNSVFRHFSAFQRDTQRAVYRKQAKKQRAATLNHLLSIFRVTMSFSFSVFCFGRVMSIHNAFSRSERFVHLDNTLEDAGERITEVQASNLYFEISIETKSINLDAQKMAKLSIMYLKTYENMLKFNLKNWTVFLSELALRITAVCIQ